MHVTEVGDLRISEEIHKGLARSPPSSRADKTSSSRQWCSENVGAQMITSFYEREN